MAGGDRPGAVIVTGATYGIGRGIVLDLARRGWPGAQSRRHAVVRARATNLFPEEL